MQFRAISKFTRISALTQTEYHKGERKNPGDPNTVPLLNLQIKRSSACSIPFSSDHHHPDAISFNFMLPVGRCRYFFADWTRLNSIGRGFVLAGIHDIFQFIAQGFVFDPLDLVLAMLIRRYRFEVVRDQQIEINPLITLRPRYGMKVRVKKRE